MFGGQTWKDRSDLYCQISVFTLSLNVALKLKLRIKYLSAAKWQCATGLSPQDTSWAHTFGIIKRSMGKNKLLLYLITKKKKKKKVYFAVFSLFCQSPVLFPALCCLVMSHTYVLCSLQLWHLFPVCCPLTLSLFLLSSCPPIYFIYLFCIS